MAKLLPLPKAACYLGLTEEQVATLAERGDLVPPVRIGTGEILWRKADLRAWVAMLPAVKATSHGSEFDDTSEGDFDELPEPSRSADEVPPKLPQLAQDILRVLREAKGRSMSGEELCIAIGHGDQTGGYWSAITRKLRDLGLIVSSPKNGYRLAEPPKA